ncbi:hypothetical protein [Variovorax ginsengisoli]|uniref:Uncharacterized protein n=1 Tax=Variovorax ginsengisoli TaxID=363844 RepID=A0ABT8S6V5_9BURK|nr:hypothetical protein [Variovorax ginsengisoli]MDN8614772.1 hypothetical protein [Variovorax ginsengisoli]MDO1533942.1 hypothetical protein [Variovorax ginsengisoli]
MDLGIGAVGLVDCGGAALANSKASACLPGSGVPMRVNTTLMINPFLWLCDDIGEAMDP